MFHKAWKCGCCVPIVRGDLLRFTNNKERIYKITKVKAEGINLTCDGAGHEQQTYVWHVLAIACEYSKDGGKSWNRCTDTLDAIPSNHIIICGNLVIDAPSYDTTSNTQSKPSSREAREEVVS